MSAALRAHRRLSEALGIACTCGESNPAKLTQFHTTPGHSRFWICDVCKKRDATAWRRVGVKNPIAHTNRRPSIVDKWSALLAEEARLGNEAKARLAHLATPRKARA